MILDRKTNLRRGLAVLALFVATVGVSVAYASVPIQVGDVLSDSRDGSQYLIWAATQPNRHIAYWKVTVSLNSGNATIPQVGDNLTDLRDNSQYVVWSVTQPNPNVALWNVLVSYAQA